MVPPLPPPPYCLSRPLWHVVIEPDFLTKSVAPVLDFDSNLQKQTLINARTKITMIPRTLLRAQRLATKFLSHESILAGSRRLIHASASWNYQNSSYRPAVRGLHQDFQQGLNNNLGGRSRDRLIGRLDRILKSRNALESMSIEQLAHIQYLRDYWALRDQEGGSSDRELKHMDVMSHETNEVLGRYSTSTENGNITPAKTTTMPVATTSAHRQWLAKIESIFGTDAKNFARQMVPFRRLFLFWVVTALLAVPLLLLFEKVLMRLFPERARALEAAEKRKYQEAHEMLYGKR